MAVPFHSVDEELVVKLSTKSPCREAQIRALLTLLDPAAARCQNLVVHGTEATGKSTVVASILAQLQNGAGVRADDGPLNAFTVVNTSECITARHLLETILGKAARALAWRGARPRCENVSQLTVELSKMLIYADRSHNFTFTLVLDDIDRQRELSPTLLPALARLPEAIACLAVVFVVTAPLAHFLRTSFVPHVEFPSYTKAELVKILSAEPCEPLPGVSAQDLAELQIRFLGAVHDAVVKPAARTLPAFKEACTALWPKFTAPIVAGSHGAREFSKLLVAARMHLQNESFLDPPLVAPLEPKVALLQAKTASKPASKSLAAELALLLPTTARLLLVAAYLASHNATRHDLTLFSTFHHGRKRRGGGGLSVPGAGNSRRGPRSKHRKIARKLLGAHAFVLERMLAIFAAVQAEWDGRPATAAVHLDADVGMALATLARLRLLVRVGTAGDLLDRSGKWRVNVGWELVKGLGRSMGIEVEEWLVE